MAPLGYGSGWWQSNQNWALLGVVGTLARIECRHLFSAEPTRLCQLLASTASPQASPNNSTQKFVYTSRFNGWSPKRIQWKTAHCLRLIRQNSAWQRRFSKQWKPQHARHRRMTRKRLEGCWRRAAGRSHVFSRDWTFQPEAHSTSVGNRPTPWLHFGIDLFRQGRRNCQWATWDLRFGVSKSTGFPSGIIR